MHAARCAWKQQELLQQTDSAQQLHPARERRGNRTQQDTYRLCQHSILCGPVYGC